MWPSWARLGEPGQGPEGSDVKVMWGIRVKGKGTFIQCLLLCSVLAHPVALKPYSCSGEVTPILWNKKLGLSWVKDLPKSHSWSMTDSGSKPWFVALQSLHESAMEVFKLLGRQNDSDVWTGFERVGIMLIHHY